MGAVVTAASQGLPGEGEEWSMTGHFGRFRRLVAIVVLLAGAVLAVVTLSGVLSGRGDSAPDAALVVPQVGRHDLNAVIYATQDKLRRLPGDAVSWARLGAAYVEQARITADPLFYAKAQSALEKSLQLVPLDNVIAMIGMGQLANARHDFAAGQRWGEQAKALRPGTAEIYGVLADALTQLGDVNGATTAVQSMLDIHPGVASFTRASYDLELHGRVEDARSALERALGVSASPDDVAFCRYYLGELAFNAGQLDEASNQYHQGLLAVPGNVALLHGTAKVAAATGNVPDALAGYAQITSRVPLPQYVLEYGELLESVGQGPQARGQYDLLTAQQQLYAAQGSVDDLVASQVAADHGNPTDALRSAQREWTRRQSVFSADALAWALHVNGRDSDALAYADKAAALGWRNATFAYHRGMILTSLGRAVDARAALSQALVINQHFSPLAAPRARQTLAELGGPR
ncbi:MAG: tetratricopeptide repeat protein [Pseudonocardiaceae bacterium]